MFPGVFAGAPQVARIDVAVAALEPFVDLEAGWRVRFFQYAIVVSVHGKGWVIARWARAVFRVRQ